MPWMWFKYQVSLLVIGRFVWKLEPCKPTDRVSQVLNERCLTFVAHAHPLCYHAWRCSQLWIPTLIHYKPKHSTKNCMTKVKCSPSWPNQSHKSIRHRQGIFHKRESNQSSTAICFLWWSVTFWYFSAIITLFFKKGGFKRYIFHNVILWCNFQFYEIKLLITKIFLLIRWLLCR